jgi:hypothetical protein
MLAIPRGRGRNVSFAFDAAAQKAGMIKTKLRHMGQAYAIGDGDVFKVFFPQYIGRHGGTMILGGIGIYFTEFENWWSDILDLFDNKRRKNDGCVLGIYISNFEPMWGAPAFLAADRAGIDNWAKGIVELAHQICNPNDDLFDVVCRSKLAGIDIRAYFDHQIKVRAFNVWVRLQRPEITRALPIYPLVEQRIWPFAQEFEFLKARYSDVEL